MDFEFSTENNVIVIKGRRKKERQRREREERERERGGKVACHLVLGLELCECAKDHLESSGLQDKI